MKNYVILLISVLSINLSSCTDNTEILEKNEKQELQLINKEDVEAPGGRDDKEPDFEED